MATNSNAAAKTGAGPTAMVAVEQFFPTNQRVIEDDLAYQILPLGSRIFVQLMRLPLLRNWMVSATEKQIKGIWSAIMCRKRYIDDKLTEALAQEKLPVVNLGAGFDTRAYRLPVLLNTSVWEIDQAANINTKISGVKHIFGEIPEHVQLISINFEDQTLDDVLASHGYKPDTRTFFIWEAVTQYLTEEAFRGTFEFLSKAPSGSRLAFTYVLRDFIEGKNLYEQETVYKQMIVNDTVWQFGMNPDEVAGILEPYGWKVLEDRSYQELADQYVKPTGRNLPSLEIERMVYAECV